ncbi:hypothetical protein AT864_00843 [Anoxybacillus sp. P3H1B]|uniref:Uncharacterized protein n=1 Tax=Anoxybacteroides rupiense TaxID=311460 RepID=A0ABD5IY50_9BACL|nr:MULTISPECIES: hypothetical protein [Anoxybacillus]KXG10252.1 hypothetical protein AT864_00843 [Anoxybacillus sp. P3H1B]MBB3909377.1 hypothetical protein [Anoxybacillus rupiensis]MCL6588251.1 hypothetical protein [Anoxybacillus sp.]MED5053280.1 hypothetical protein [Anoxybacillus rupiensis]
MVAISIEVMKPEPNIHYELVNEAGNERVYQVSLYNEDDSSIENIRDLLINFLTLKNEFPTYIYFEAFDDFDEDLKFHGVDFQILKLGQIENKKKNFSPIFKVKAQNIEELRTVVDQTYNFAIATLPYYITFTSNLNFDLRKWTFPEQVAIPKFDFTSPTSYIWIGYDGLFFELITNEARYLDSSGFIKELPRYVEVVEVIESYS